MAVIARPAELRERFHALGKARDEILARSTPMRASRDQLSNKYDAEIRGLDVAIKEAEKDLYDVDVERALIARALGGKTGEA